MDRDYFSVDSILAGNQKIQCVFKQVLPDLGHLAGGTEPDLAISSKAQIPIWLAYILIFSDWAEFNIPTAFGPRVRNALNAEATSVRLSSLVGAGNHWYGFGKTITDLLAEEQAREISKLLLKTFRSRLVEIVDQAQHFAVLGPGNTARTDNDIAQAFREGLEATERDIFILAQESAKGTKKWHEESDRTRR